MGQAINKTQRMVFIAVLASQAIVLGYIEMLISLPTAVLGIKIGLANIVSIVTLAFLGFFPAIEITIIRCFAVSLFAGGLTMLLFSLTGGVISVTGMYLLYRVFKDRLSFWSISIAGAVLHNAAQVAVASVIIKDISIYYYMPILLISAIITGIITGIVAQSLIKLIRSHYDFML